MYGDDGTIEIAMTHVVGADGLRRVCPRPQTVRTVAVRVRAWRDAPEACGSCVSANAVRLVAGMALCARCREHRSLRMAGLDLLDRQLRTRPAVSGQGFEGHAVVFNQLSGDLGGFREQIAADAVNRTLTEQIDLRALWNHNADTLLGRISANTLAVWKDKAGLAMEIVPPQSAYAQMESVDRGDVTGASFGFRVLDDDWNDDGTFPIRTVTDMRMSEVSIVAFPAYPQTDVRVGKHVTIAPKRSISWLQRWHKTQLAR